MRDEVCSECGEPATRDTEFCVQCGAFLDWSRVEQETEEDGRTDPVRVPTGGAAESDAGASAVPPPREPEPARRPAGARVAGTPDRAARSAERPRAPTTAVQSAAVEPAVPGCPRCGTENPPELRFCGKCGYEFPSRQRATAWDARPRPRIPWWRRLISGDRTPAERSALRAYRRSLPMRYRLIRAGLALMALLLVVGAFFAVQRDPIGWAKARWYDVQDTVQPVRGGTPALDPPGGENVEFPPAAAVDGSPDTAWATTWLGTGDPAGCGAPQTNGGLLVTFAAPVDLRRLDVVAGLPSGDPFRPTQPRPSVLELRFSDGNCLPVPVSDSGDVQVVELPEPVSTTSVRIDVADVYPAADGGVPFVTVSEVEFLQRPPT
jgi:hypothetical protein